MHVAKRDEASAGTRRRNDSFATLCHPAGHRLVRPAMYRIQISRQSPDTSSRRYRRTVGRAAVPVGAAAQKNLGADKNQSPIFDALLGERFDVQLGADILDRQPNRT